MDLDKSNQLLKRDYEFLELYADSWHAQILGSNFPLIGDGAFQDLKEITFECS